MIIIYNTRARFLPRVFLFFFPQRRSNAQFFSCYVTRRRIYRRKNRRYNHRVSADRLSNIKPLSLSLSFAPPFSDILKNPGHVSVTWNNHFSSSHAGLYTVTSIFLSPFSNYTKNALVVSIHEEEYVRYGLFSFLFSKKMDEIFDPTFPKNKIDDNKTVPCCHQLASSPNIPNLPSFSRTPLDPL